MNLRHLAVFGCIALASCGRKPAPAPPATPSPAPSAAVPKPAPAPPRLTLAQVGSVVRVRAAFGGMPPRDSIAALLDRAEIPYLALARGRNRCVLAPLKDWSEEQLRHPAAVLLVYRDKVDRVGRRRVVAHPARLIQFDAAAGVGILAYAEDFDYAEDVGFRLPHGAAYPPDLLLRTFQTAAAAGQAGNAPAFSVDAGTARRTGPNTVAPLLPPLEAGATADPTQLAVSGSNLLAGFVEGGAMQGLEQFAVALKPPRFDVTEATFDFSEGGGGRYAANFTVSSAWGDRVPGTFQVAALATAPGTDPKKFGPDAGGGFLPISDKAEVNKTRTSWRGALPNQWTVDLPVPTVDQQAYYLIQISWPLFEYNDSPKLVGEPLLVRFERRAGRLSAARVDRPSATGADNPPATGIAETGYDEPAAVSEAVKFPLEAAAADVHLIASGREALIHLESAPYWKRFSFEKNDWLPLPPGVNRNNVAITGNLTALFVLDRGTRELRKYALPALEPAGAVRLPPGDYLGVLAGCNSEHAPVFLPTTFDPLIIDPVTLQPRTPPEQAKPGPPPRPNTEQGRYLITGDGLGLLCYKENGGGYLHYNSSVRGLEGAYQNSKQLFTHEWAPGVSAGFTLNGGGLSAFDAPGGKPTDWGHPAMPWTEALPELAENAPVVFRVLRPETRTTAPQVTRLGCFAFPSAVPFAQVDAPELAGVHDRVAGRSINNEKDRWVFFDPFSLRLATLAADRRTWCVRTIARQENRRQPVLLNWPDTTVARGEKLAFKPLLFGGKKFAAGVLGKTTAPTVNEAAGTLSWPVAPLEFDSLQLLDLTVPGAGEAPISYPIALHVAGPELPFVTPPGLSAEGLNQKGASVTNLGESNEDCHPISALLYQLPEAVSTMVGPVSGCVVLATPAGRIDFFSLSTRRIVGSTVGPAGAWYYSGAGALLEYDPGKRTLTRISVPDGRREASLPIPPFVELRGIGAGADRASPITLSADITQSQSVLRFSDLTLTERDIRQAVFVLDGQTLRAQGRTQPITLAHLLGKPEQTTGNSFASIGAADSRPASLPTSRNGCMVSLPLHFLALGQKYAVAYPFLYGDALDRMVSLGLGGQASGSLSGLMAFSSTGQAYKGGIPVGGAADYLNLGASPDGLYQFRLVQAGPDEYVVDIRLAESDRPLLRMARLPFLAREQFYGAFHKTQRLLMLGDHGPLAILSTPGRTLELIDLDVATEARLAVPEEFHVVSQPVPYVMEGRTMRYEVRVNNPDAVESYKLQGAVPGAELSAAGVLTYTAPAAITGATRVTIPIEIRGKNGQAALHEFPVYVLPFPRTAPNKPAAI